MTDTAATPKVKLKIEELDLRGLKKRLDGFHEHKQKLVEKPSNGSATKQKNRQKSLEDLNRVIPIAERLLGVKRREHEIPFGD